jgi:hypothetical protein
VAGEKKAVEGSYVLASANQIGFRLGEYDHSQPLVIDPVLSYSTYLGGSSGGGGWGYRRRCFRKCLRDGQYSID